MAETTPQGRSRALSALAHQVFGDKTFSDAKTGVGVVATKWILERPMIFKGSVGQAHGRTATFTRVLAYPLPTRSWRPVRLTHSSNVR